MAHTLACLVQFVSPCRAMSEEHRPSVGSLEGALWSQSDR